MYRIIDKRASGKTCRLMLLAKEIGAVIFCANPNDMKKKALEYGLVGIDFYSYRDFYAMNNIEQDLKKPYLVDNLDCLVKSWNSRLVGYSIDSED